MTFQGIKLNYFFDIDVFFWMYLTNKERICAHFSWFLGRGIYSTVWTRSGSKVVFRNLVFKGLKNTTKSINYNEILIIVP